MSNNKLNIYRVRIKGTGKYLSNISTGRTFWLRIVDAERVAKRNRVDEAEVVMFGLYEVVR